MTIRVLGPMDTGESALGARERTVLAALIVRRGMTVAPEELAQAWWGDTPPPTWHQQIRNSVARIRSRIGRDTVETVSADYRLGLQPDSLDVVQFERLVSGARQRSLHGEHERAVDAYRRALALWRGQPLQDVADWEPGVVEAMRLGEIRSSAEEELLDALLQSGEDRTVVADAERLVREDPLREDRWAILALANYRLGRQADALAALRAARERLGDELGIEPGARLTDLEMAILRQDPALDAPAVTVASQECPYPGLRSFEPDDADLFFGRGRDIDAVLERLRPGRVVLVAGPSGCGKSSLILAGVVPRLRSSGRSVAIIQPSRDGSDAARFLAAHHAVLVVDQAEEILAQTSAASGEFDVALATALEAGCAVVLTARSDSLDRLRALPSLGQAIEGSVVLLGPLSAESWREAIEVPARLTGLRLEPGLVEVVVRDAGDRTSTLPHLSHALRQTWLRREGTVLTVAGYEAAGGIAGAIAQSAEEVYRSLRPEEQRVCRALMLRLVERGSDGVSSRRPVALAIALSDSAHRAVAERLTSARLLSVDQTSIMVAHEAIATAWPRLDGWLQEDADSSRMLRIVESAASNWLAAERDPDELLRGARLHSAATWREESTPDLAPSEQEYLEASLAQERTVIGELESRAARERGRNRALRSALGIAAGMLVIALVAGVIAGIRAREASAAATEQRIEALAATSLAVRSTDRDIAALLAVEVARQSPDDPRGRSALLGSLTAAGGLVSRRIFPDTARLSGTVIPQSRSALVVTESTQDPDPEADLAPAQLSIVDLDTGEITRNLDVVLPADASQWGRDISISPDGTVAAIQSPGFRDPDDPNTCCRNTLTFIDLPAGTRRGADVVLDTRTSRDAIFAADNAEVYFIHSVTADPMAIDTRTGVMRTNVVRDPDEYSGAQGIRNALARIGDRLYVGDGSAIIVYDAASLAEVDRIDLGSDYNIETQLLPDSQGGLIAIGGEAVMRIDLATKGVTWRRSFSAQRCELVEPSGESGQLLCLGPDGVAYTVDLADGTRTQRAFPFLSDWASSMAVLPGGDEFATFLQRSPSAIQVWRLDGAPAITTPIAAGHAITDGFSGDGSTLILAKQEDLENGDWSRQELWDVEADTAIGVPADYAWVSGDTLQVWSESDGPHLQSLSGGPPIRIERSQDDPDDYYVRSGGMGDRAYIVEKDRIRPIDVATGRADGADIGPFDVDMLTYLLSLSELPDQERVVITWFDPISITTQTAVFDIDSGEKLSEGLETDVQSVATADGDVISANASRLVRSSDLLEPLESFAKSGTAPTMLRSSVDSKTLLLASYGGALSLYDLPSGRRLGDEIKPFMVSVDAPPPASLSADGTQMVTGAEDGVLLWDLSDAALVEAACTIAGRELTALEWKTYIGSDPQQPACADVID